ncbi:MAG: glutaredoxin family protein [Candidatus Bathyarchaeota archaeon]|nr:glutaredoxin family protein [Candidatus Bathyarchaeota archaeon]
MKAIKVPGKNRKHKVLLYTLSTCGWCKLTKKFCKNHEIEYEYVDVDLCSEEEREEIRKDILKRGGRLSYPVVIIDDKILINGFHEDKIQEALGT